MKLLWTAVSFILLHLPGYSSLSVCNELINPKYNFSLVVIAYDKTGSMFIWAYFQRIVVHTGSSWSTQNSLPMSNKIDITFDFQNCNYLPKISPVKNARYFTLFFTLLETLEKKVVRELLLPLLKQKLNKNQLYF